MLRSVVVLALVVAATASQPPTPTPAKAAQNNKGQGQLEENKVSDDKQQPGALSTAINQPPSQVATWNQTEPEAKHQDSAPVEYWSKVTAIVVAAATAFLVVLGALQWWTMRTQAEYIHQQQRAWMAIIKVSGDPTIGRPVSVAVEAINSGGTPAKRLRTMAVARLLGEYSALGKWVVAEGALRSTGLIAPHHTITTTATRVAEVSEAVLTKKDVDDIKSGRLTLFVDGRIEYRDIFDKHHWVTFCYVWRLFKSPHEWHYQVYETGNDMDEPGTEGTPLL